MPDSRKHFFNQKGVKNTKHRGAILEILETSAQPLTTEEVFLMLKEKGEPINLSTIYRTFELFADKNLVVKTKFEDGLARYELNHEKHQHHVICLNCRKMMVVGESECPFSTLEKSIRQNTGFEVTRHKLELYGYCQDCSKMTKH